MSAKVVWYREAWWIRTHFAGTKKREKKIGPTAVDKRRAERIAEQINARLALGSFHPDKEDGSRAVPCDDALRRWHYDYAPTFKPSYEVSSRGVIEGHLVPFFGARNLQDLTEGDLLAFVRDRIDAGLAPNTVRNALSILRRVLNLLQRDGKIERNVAARVGELMRRVDRRTAQVAGTADSWSRDELRTLLEVAREHEPGFYPALATLCYSGMRVGELLGLHWTDVDLDRGRIHVRRAWVRGQMTTPKSGRSRFVLMAPALAALLLDLLAERRRQALSAGWPDLPEHVFCSEAGTPQDDGNLRRTWERVRRRARAAGVRPLKLHCARHTWATLALESGKSVRWVADQLGHADPSLTLRTYARALRETESDLGFLNIEAQSTVGAPPARGEKALVGIAIRRYPSPSARELERDLAKSATVLAPPGRLELPTRGLGNRCSIP